MESSASESPAWLDWAKELQFIAQAGLTYSKDPFDLERFQRIRDILAEIMSRHTGLPYEQVRHLFFCTPNGVYCSISPMKQNTIYRIYIFCSGVLTKLDSFHQWGMANSD